MFKSQRMTHADGTMHHLGTVEKDIAETMILTAGVEEVPEISALLDEAKQTGHYREYLTYLGKSRELSIGVMSSGHGCMPMAIAVEELNHLGAKTLVKVGSGLALQKDMKPGTLVVPTAAVRGEGATKEYIGYEYPAVADGSLIERLMAASVWHGEDPKTGIARSHDSFYAEYPAAPDGMEKLEKWSRLGVLLLENELSSMFVISSILKLRAAAIYVVDENPFMGEKLSEGELKKRLEACYRIAIDAVQ